MQATVSSDTYVLGRSEAETERLIRQAQIYAPFTRHFFVSAGITAGMKVLDVGSGAGDVALLLAELVGPHGAVVGFDTNPDILATARERARAAGWTNVRFVEADAHSIALDGEFDAVVGRWVLMHMSEPVAALRRLAGHLRPGGVAAFQESDFSYPPTSFPRAPLHQQVVRWTVPPPSRDRPGPYIGTRLYETFLDAGLPAPQLRLDAPIGGGADWPGYEYVAATARSVLPIMERMGLVRAEEVGIETLADRLRAEVVGQRGVQMLPIVIGAWARRAAHR